MTHHLSRATAHLWIEQPLEMKAKNRKGKTNQLFDTHPPIGERIAILRKLEGLDPDERGPVDATITGVPVDLAELQASSRTGVGTRIRRRSRRVRAASAAPTAAEADASVAVGEAPAGHPPGWYHADAQTLRYWDGQQWTDWTATWNGARWVQQRPA